VDKRNLYNLIFIVFSLPATLFAARLELRQSGTGATEATALVGQEVEIEIWIDSESEELSGAAIFLSFDETRFALVDEDRVPRAGFQPFAPGEFLGNGEIYRNYLLAEDDPAAGAPGTQLDYSVVRAGDQGQGPIASFRLRTLAPTIGSAIRIDESGVRETRMFLPDGQQRAFRFITPFNLSVKGISISGLSEKLILARGSTRELYLNDLVFDPLYGPDDLTWTISKTAALTSTREGNNLLLETPADASPWERLVLTVANPEGQTASDTVDIFVNAAPTLSDIGPLVFAEDESYEIPLDALVDDPDSPAESLTWSSWSESPKIEVEITGSPASAHIVPQPEWHGQGQITLMVQDNYDFADTLHLEVSVDPVNDAPRLLSSPNLRLTSSTQDSSLVLAELIADIEDPASALNVSWSGNERVGLEFRNERLILSSPADWEGLEEITLVVEDSGGLTDTALLTVTVVPSLPPALIAPPQRLGLAAGEHHLLVLGDLAVDPDNRAEDLVWTVHGHTYLSVQFSGGNLARIEAPANFIGIETLTFSVADPSGSSSAFELIVFAASTDGGPLLAELPEIQMPLLGVDTSIDLDHYAFDPDHTHAELAFFLPVLDEVELRVDPLTHLLIVEPGANAQPGLLELEVRVVDPDGHEAVQILRLELLGENNPATPSFDLAEIPSFTLITGKIHSFSLDAFVIGDVEPATVLWQVQGQQNLIVAIDPSTRQVSVHSADAWIGNEEVTFIAEVPDLPPRARTVRIAIIADPNSPPLSIVPELNALPLLQIEAGTFDQTLDLNTFLSNADAADFTWKLSGGAHVRALVDTETYHLLVFTDEGFSGEETLLLIGTLADGTRLETALEVEVYSQTLGFALNPQTEVPLLAGAATLRLPFDQLVSGDVDPSLLTWVAKGLQPISASYDAQAQTLVLTPEIPWQSSDLIELVAIDPQGNEYTGIVRAQVFPADGSAGIESEDFQLVILPNPLQPEYVDLYLISRLDQSEAPILRIADGAWNDLTTTAHSAGIWRASHVFAPGQRGQFEFLALSFDADNELFKSMQTWSLTNTRKIAAKYTGGYGWPAD